MPRQDINNGTTMIGLRLRRDDHYERLMSHPRRAPSVPSRDAPAQCSMFDLLLRRGVALACYHGVGELSDAGDPKRLVVAPHHLEAHVLLLRRLGYRFFTAEEALETGLPSSHRRPDVRRRLR